MDGVDLCFAYDRFAEFGISDPVLPFNHAVFVSCRVARFIFHRYFGVWQGGAIALICSSIRSGQISPLNTAYSEHPEELPGAGRRAKGSMIKTENGFRKAFTIWRHDLFAGFGAGSLVSLPVALGNRDLVQRLSSD